MIPAALLLLATTLPAIEPRKSPAEYPAQGKGEDIEIGADYTVRTFLAEGHTLTIDDYLLVEVGVYPVGETTVLLQRFTLRINGKNDLLPQTPGMVAGSLKYPDWRRKPQIVGSAGPVIFGGPQATGRFPGDPRGRNPAPRPNPAPMGKEVEPIDYGDLLSRNALPEGRTKRAVDGYIYFAYDGKLKSIKSVELLVDGKPVKLR